MKHLHYVFAFLLCFLLQNAYSQNQWTFYSNSHYKGYHKSYDSGEMKVSNQWKWNSWKSNCCIKFYYYTRHGKVNQKILCGDVRSFTDELKKGWDDMKYGYRHGWKNIQKVELYCDKKYASNNNGSYNGNQKNHNRNRSNYNNRNDYKNNGNNYNNRQERNGYTSNRNRNNYNDRNVRNEYNNKKNHRGNKTDNTKGDFSRYDWYKYYGKGNVIFTSDNHYGGQYKARASGSLDYRSLRFYPKSILVAKSGRYLIVEYKDQYNRRKSFKLKEDVSDLNKYMASNLRLGDKYEKDPYKAITKFTIMRY